MSNPSPRPKLARFLITSATLTLSVLGARTATAEEPATPAVRSANGRSIIAHSAARLDPPGALGETPMHPNAGPALLTPFAGTPIDVTTFHYDAKRTGWNPHESHLTPANVASPKFGLLKKLQVDGNVFAQPLLVSGFEFADRSKRDVLVVATGHNTVYAYDAQTYALIWKRNLGAPQSSNDVFCDDVVPEYGITSTPVIVRDGPGKASIYVVAATEPNAFEFHSPLHRLDVATGADLVRPVEIDPQTTLSDGTLIQYDPSSQWTRAALAWGNNALYVTVSSHCDNNAFGISGWVLRYDPKLRRTASFHTIADPAGYKLASVWGAGFGPAMDDTGQIYAVTGNGDFDADAGGHNYGESVIALSPGLGEVRTSFTPGAFLDLNDEDRDFGSGGVMLLPPLGKRVSGPIRPLAAGALPIVGMPVPPLAVTIGKDNVLYLLNALRMGGRQPRDQGALQALRIGESAQGVWGGPAYYGGPNGPTVFVQNGHATLKSFQVSVSAKTAPTLVAGPTGTSPAGYGGSMPIVSSDGDKPGTGVVWVVRRLHDPQLEAYDATRLGKPIYRATAGTWANPSNNAFVSAMEANGRVYVGTAGSVTVFGLAP